MEASFTHSGDNIAEVTITASVDEVARYIDEAYSAVASRGRYPGFRPGKVPHQVIDARVGRTAVLADALESLVEDLYPLAIDSTGLRPIEAADHGELDALQDGAPYTFTARVEVKPQPELTSDDPVKVKVGSAEPTEREVEAQIDHMRDRFATLVPADRGVEIGDFVLVSFVNSVDGEELQDSRVDKYLYETGRSIMPAEFEQALIGAEAGENRRAEFVIPESSSAPHLVGKTTAFEIEVHEVKAKELPEVDDEFASSVGDYESAEEMRDGVRTRLAEGKATGRIRDLEAAARRALAERIDIEIPDSMVTHRAKALTEEFLGTLQQRSISIDDYIEATGVQLAQIEEDIGERARALIREELALEALFRAQGMEIADDELASEVAQISGSEPGATERMQERLRQTGMIPLLKEEIMHRRATRWLMDNVEVEDEDAEPTAESAGKKPAPAKRRKRAKADEPDAAAVSEEE